MKWSFETGEDEGVSARRRRSTRSSHSSRCDRGCLQSATYSMMVSCSWEDLEITPSWDGSSTGNLRVHPENHQDQPKVCNKNKDGRFSSKAEGFLPVLLRDQLLSSKKVHHQPGFGPNFSPACQRDIRETFI